MADVSILGQEKVGRRARKEPIAQFNAGVENTDQSKCDVLMIGGNSSTTGIEISRASMRKAVASSACKAIVEQSPLHFVDRKTPLDAGNGSSCLAGPRFFFKDIRVSAFEMWLSCRRVWER
ncbi:hypothetical protein CONPUDRAFT_139393 [Coniophora puteana RWD-64-598 SS2]|uniref:Uncharacterized protein n=1 Tax=Coniophora puteana (strain RWD-64-598) TaxID=741705 RepID=A0A5M3MBN8_CONPW|nr:uncharacterized protein CONPUDRAFT_139393 [Coniophora puteana RWD-64-598 SS2]EIW76648.1 hypothetical protein CONPUDRAFT_139393 [Coniophora puteana RWD-64-598 SS2]